MHADRYFAQGKTHKVNQDYARAGRTSISAWPPFAYALLSDGCTGDGTTDTDFGSRFLTLAAEQRLRIWGRMEGGGPQWAFWEAARRAYQLDDSCLDATLLMAYESSSVEGEAQVMVLGDGVFAALYNDGSILCTEVEFEPSTDGRVYPFYLSYMKDRDRLNNYLGLEAGYYRTTQTLFSPEGVPVDEPVVSEPCRMIDKVDEVVRLYPLTEAFNKEDVTCVAVFSDGIQTFWHENQPKRYVRVPVGEVLAEVMAIKNPSGEFVHRRCHRFMTRTAPKKGWHHNDDFSMAALWLKD